MTGMSRPVQQCPRVEDTVALGERIGARLRPGDLLSLRGPLGAGKTVLVRGMAAGAGVDPGAVRSPTFVLHHVYQGARLRLHHVDLYRLGPGADIGFLDLDELVATGAVVVEWGDLTNLTGFDPVHIDIEPGARETREVRLAGDARPELRAAWPASSATR